MATCSKCGKKISILNTSWSNDGLCLNCAQDAYELSNAEQIRSVRDKEKAAQAEADAEEAAIQAVLLTTETAPNLNIVERIEIVTAECAFGMNIFRDLFAAVRDVVGGRSEAVQKTMRDARKTALHELKREAWLVGANAVVGVDLDYTEISSSGNMILLVASGTAVRIG